VLLGPLGDAIERCAIPSAGASVKIVAAELGDEAELVGALSVAADLHRASGRSVG
jgi:hypothetical protein